MSAHDRAAAGGAWARASHWIHSRAHAVCVEGIAIVAIRQNAVMREEQVGLVSSLTDALELIRDLSTRPNTRRRLH